MMNTKYLKSVCKGISGSLILCLTGFTLLSVFIDRINIGMSMYNFIYVCIALISLSIGCIIAAKNNGCKGWLVGLGVAIGYYLVLIIFSISLINGFEFQSKDLLKFTGVIFIGIVSGILGINM